MGGLKLTPKLQESICEAIKSRLYIRRACELHGIGKTTYYDWIGKGEAGEEPYAGFVAAVRQAEAQDIRDTLAEAKAIATQRKSWEERHAYIEKRYKEEYGRNTALIETLEKVAANQLYISLMEKLLNTKNIESEDNRVKIIDDMDDKESEDNLYPHITDKSKKRLLCLGPEIKD